MYAIVNISGKQVKATIGSIVRVPKQVGEKGSTIKFHDVLLTKDGESTKFGKPLLSGVSITATIEGHQRDKKILVYKKKRRKGYQRKNGHRQWYTEVKFQKINFADNKAQPTGANATTKPLISEISTEEE